MGESSMHAGAVRACAEPSGKDGRRVVVEEPIDGSLEGSLSMEGEANVACASERGIFLVCSPHDSLPPACFWINKRTPS